jgi:hypothetical protein
VIFEMTWELFFDIVLLIGACLTLCQLGNKYLGQSGATA